MASPINVLKQHIFPSLRRVAPEKTHELIAYLEREGIRFRFDETEHRIFFQADSAGKIITVGEKCLERLWASAYAYFLFYEAMTKAKHRDIDNREVNLNEVPELRAAGDLLSWATSVDWQVRVEGKHLAEPLPKWPDSVPRPIENPEAESNEDVADKLFLSAVGFILHHERAHIQFGHVRTEGVESVLNEKDADAAAAKWLLEGLEQDDKEFIQRVFGIATALIWLASLDAYSEHSSSSHPPGYDRLYQVLLTFVDDSWHPVWSFVSIALRLHLDASNAVVDDEMTHDSPQEAVNYYCDVLSKRFKRDSE